MEIEDIGIRFGMIAVKMGFTTPDQIVDALEIQVKENLSTGKHRRIGKILLDLGFLSQIQMKEVLQELDQIR
jgi:hypothetical protein